MKHLKNALYTIKNIFSRRWLLILPVLLVVCVSFTSAQESTVTELDSNSVGIKTDCLGKKGGTCGMNVYKILNIKKSNQNQTVESFVQDIVLSLTMFFGTVFAIVILFSGVLYIVSAFQGSDSLQSKAKKGLTGGVIGLVLVTGAFGIVRFVQFMVAGGS